MTTTDAARAEAYAAYCREQSERMIRAHAHRLVAGHQAALRTMPPERRRDELLSLAGQVADGVPHADELVAAVLPYLSDVEGAAAAFDVLVVAVRDRAQFVGDPDEWLASRGLSLSPAVFDGQDEVTAGAVDSALDVLMGKSSAVTR